MASELLDEFIFDSREHLTTAGTQLLELEKKPDSLADLNALMGTLHTIKGNSGFVNLRNLYSALHGAENLLQTVRDTPGHVCPPPIINQLFQVLDAVEAILSRLESGEDEDVDWLPALNQAIREAEASLTRTDDGSPKDEPAPSPAQAVSKGQMAIKAQEQPPKSQAPSPDPREAGLGDKIGEPEATRTLEAELTKEVEAEADLGEEAKFDTLEDGDLSSNVNLYLDFLKKGRGHLVLDVNSLSSLSFDEIRTIRELVILDDSRFALILDRDKQPDFWRVLVLWSLENKIKTYPSLDLAKDDISA
jgi:chemotaxis protein histidine kinase CheA